MSQQSINLSSEQWNFLSILHAFDEPVSIDIAGALAPIPPGQFLDLMGRNNNLRCIYKSENEHYAIIPEIASQLEKQLCRMNNQERLNEIVDKLYNDKLIGQVCPKVIEKLLAKLDQAPISAEIEITLAQLAIENKDESRAFDFLTAAVRRLYPFAENEEASHLFIRAVIEIIPIWLYSGENLYELISFMKKALKISKKIGDKRSHAIINLHLSVYYELVGQDEEMWNSFTSGYQSVKELGDNDILRRTSSLLGANLIHQGMYKEAEPLFERILPPILSSESNEEMSYLKRHNIYYYGTCLIFLGKFLEAIGFLHLCHAEAEKRSDRYDALFVKNVLGVALLIIKQIKQAKNILENAIEESKSVEPNYNLYLLYFNLSYAYFLEGQFEKSQELISKTSAIGEKLGTIHFPMANYILEMLFEMNQRGYALDERFKYSEQVARILNGKNHNLKGVVLRLEATAMSMANEGPDRIQSYLKKSEKHLKQSGDSIQLGKTLIEMARLHIKKGDNKSAVQHLKKAQAYFGDYVPEFFPEDLKHLLNDRSFADNAGQSWKNRYLSALEVYDFISLKDGRDDIRSKALRSLAKMMGAERAAIFWYDNQKESEKKDHYLLYNITPFETKSPKFRLSRDLIRESLKTKTPCIWKVDQKSYPKNPFSIRSMFCLSGTITHNLAWVLYLDNHFLKEQYNRADPLLIAKLIKQSACGPGPDLGQEQNKTKRSTSDFGENIQANGSDEMQFHNPIMAELISKTDKVAKTDSSVLIYGETGTGKELLARRMHYLSHRSKNPFIVVDLTSIPENLLESELFGHEKGAFTGAISRKKGRLEVVHKGTLFLDEIGEIPLSLQVKLLRLLQEKKFIRIGGAQTLHVDFRLIAATNRNLEEEVAAGRFRKDLYYRLCVVPVTLPPLRERQSDILLLSRYYLSKYIRKHKKPDIYLTAADESWLLTYTWPGNIRELKNIIERSVILSINGKLNLPKTESPSLTTEQHLQTRKYMLNGNEVHSIPIHDFPTLDEIQRRYINEVLKKTNGKITGSGGAVNILGMKPSSLYARMKKLGIR